MRHLEAPLIMIAISWLALLAAGLWRWWRE